MLHLSLTLYSSVTHYVFTCHSQSATPSTPVRILGLRSVPVAGEELIVVESEVKARAITERRSKVAELRALRQRDASARGEGEEVLLFTMFLPEI